MARNRQFRTVSMGGIFCDTNFSTISYHHHNGLIRSRLTKNPILKTKNATNGTSLFYIFAQTKTPTSKLATTRHGYIFTIKTKTVRKYYSLVLKKSPHCLVVNLRFGGLCEKPAKQI